MRKPKNGLAAISARLPQELYDQLLDLSKEDHRSIAYLTVQAIKNFVLDRQRVKELQGVK